MVEACRDLEDIVVGEDGAASCLFSCELGGSGASLLGIGVDSFALAEKAGLGLGRELALVVSFKQVEGPGETFDSGEDAGPGEDFWKKDMIDRCLADEEAELPLTALAGVRAPPAEVAAVLSPAMTSDDSDVGSSDAPALCESTN